MKKVLATLAFLVLSLHFPAQAQFHSGSVATDYGIGQCVSGLVEFNPDSPPAVFSIKIYVIDSGGTRYTSRLYTNMTHNSVNIDLDENIMGIYPDRVLFEIIPSESSGLFPIHKHVQCM